MNQKNNKGSVIGNLLPVILLTAAMMASLTAGLYSGGNFLTAVIVFPLLYFAFYFVTQANQLPFPMYFFIAMCFVIGNRAAVSSELRQKVIAVECGITVLVGVLNILLSIRKKRPLLPEEGLKKSIASKYQAMMEEDSKIVIRNLLHAVILYLSGIVGYFLIDYRGQWVLLASGAVLVGDQVRTLTRRGRNLIFGIVIGCALASLLGYFRVPLSRRAWIYVPAMIICMTFMPKVNEHPESYIIGSSMVALMAMVGNSLTQAYVTPDIVSERFFCGILGMIIAVAGSNIIHVLTKERVYDPSRELVQG